MDNLVYYIEKAFYDYFDLTRKTARLEFNKTIFWYSIVVIAFLYMVVDVHGFNEFMNSRVGDLQFQAMEGKLTEAEAANTVMTEFANFIPTVGLSMFALLLLPLYIRRLNDTFLPTIAFASPLVIVYAFDFIAALFKLESTFWLYDAMNFYNFIIVMVLCVIPSQYVENKDY